MHTSDSFCLNPQYSTTRTVTKVQSMIENYPASKVQTQLFLPSHPRRQGEGGLRMKGYFKKSSNDKPVVSVITIVFNGQKYLEHTIQSVLSQSYDNVEYIVIDGGSTDSTVDIIRKYEYAIDYWVSEPDNGISDAFNKGVIASTGGWINFMNCGDSFASLNVIRIFSENIDEKADLIFGKGSVADTQGNVIITTGKVFDEKKFSRRMTIPHQSAFHHKHYFQQYGIFDRNLKVAMVYDLLLRKKPLSTVFIDSMFSKMLAGGVHEAEDYLRLREARMVKQRYGSNTSRFLIGFDYWYGLTRALIKRSLICVGLSGITRKIRQMENRLK